MSLILRFLKKSKFFGVRFVYYRIKNYLPWLKPRIQDVFSPSLTSRFLSERLIDNFNGEQGHGVPEDTRDFIGLGLFHYTMIRLTRPKKVLCVGSLRGYIPAICALACQDNKYGSVDFVDAALSEGVEKWGQDGFWKKINPEEYFLKKNITHIKTYVMKTENFAKKYPRRLYEYAYIDGDHTYAGVKLDYTLFWPRIKKNGFMVFHDVLGTGEFEGAKFGINRLWNEMPDKHKITVPFPSVSGLGILQKK